MKKQWNRILLTGITCIFCIILLAGCGTKESSGGEVRIGALKGPTTMGLLSLMEQSEQNQTKNTYTVTMATAADELSAMMVKGELDIALVPANVAAVLYNKTEGNIVVIDINTLGVLYMVSGREDLTDIKSLSGSTIYLTGKGTTPDYVLQYLLIQSGIRDEVTLEYCSEATEVAALLENNPDAVGLLPQPFVTVACAQNPQLQICLSMTDEWNKTAGDHSTLLTGVTVVRKEFLEKQEGVVKIFLEEHKNSTDYAVSNMDEVASLCVKQGIIAKEGIAKKALPYCNITCITGKEMKEALSGYLQVLYEMNPASVGGSLPGEDFYYE